jgi:hypothetical protein
MSKNKRKRNLKETYHMIVMGLFYGEGVFVKHTDGPRERGVFVKHTRASPLSTAVSLESSP